MRARICLQIVGVVALLAGCSASTVASAPQPTPVSPTVAPESPTPTALAVPSPTAVPVPPQDDATVDPDPTGALPAEVVVEIPDGYELLAQATGDLNLDRRSDLAIIVRQPGDADHGPSPDVMPGRPVLLFVASADGTMQLAARSDHAALCGRCGGMFGDPFVDMTIHEGAVTIGHYGGSAWRWTNSPTFSYDIAENDWVLTHVDMVSFHATDPDGTMEDHSRTEVDPVLFADYSSQFGNP